VRQSGANPPTPGGELDFSIFQVRIAHSPGPGLPGLGQGIECQHFSLLVDTYSHVLPGMGDVAATALEEALG